MSFLDVLRGARESPSSAYQLFLLEYPKSKEEVHAFFEGHDDSSFYSGFLLRFVSDPKMIHIYKCGNKVGVYETYVKVIKFAKPNSPVLFFVDRDYSDFLGEKYTNSEKIFVTDFYSIENYLVTDDTLRTVWYDLFNFTNVSVDFEPIRIKFNDELHNFYRYLLPYSAWIIFTMRNGMHPNINNITLSKAFVISEDLTIQLIVDNGFITFLEKTCGVKTPQTFDAALPELVKELSQFEPKSYVRGKFELWFFVKFIGKLADILKRKVLVSNQSIKISIQMGEENAIEILGPRVQIPQSLKIFLEKNLMTLLQELAH